MIPYKIETEPRQRPSNGYPPFTVKGSLFSGDPTNIRKMNPISTKLKQKRRQRVRKKKTSTTAVEPTKPISQSATRMKVRKQQQQLERENKRKDTRTLGEKKKKKNLSKSRNNPLENLNVTNRFLKVTNKKSITRVSQLISRFRNAPPTPRDQRLQSPRNLNVPKSLSRTVINQDEKNEKNKKNEKNEKIEKIEKIEKTNKVNGSKSGTKISQAIIVDDISIGNGQAFETPISDMSKNEEGEMKELVQDQVMQVVNTAMNEEVTKKEKDPNVRTTSTTSSTTPNTTPQSNERTYYITNSSNNRQGPLTLEQMVEKIVLGQANGMTPTWFQGLNEWQPLGLLLEFHDLLKKVTPLSPPPPPSPSPPPPPPLKHESIVEEKVICDLESLVSTLVDDVLTSVTLEAEQKQSPKIHELMNGWTQTENEDNHQIMTTTNSSSNVVDSRISSLISKRRTVCTFVDVETQTLESRIRKIFKNHVNHNNSGENNIQDPCTLTIQLNPGIHVNITRDIRGNVNMVEEIKEELKEELNIEPEKELKAGLKEGLKQETKEEEEEKQEKSTEQQKLQTTTPPITNVEPPSVSPPPLPVPPSHPLEPLLEKWYEEDRASHINLSKQLDNVRADLQHLEREISSLGSRNNGNSSGTFSSSNTMMPIKNIPTNQEEDREQEGMKNMMSISSIALVNEEDNDLTSTVAIRSSSSTSNFGGNGKQKEIEMEASSNSSKQQWFDGRSNKSRNPLIIGLIGEVEESMRLLRLRRDRVKKEA